LASLLSGRRSFSVSPIFHLFVAHFGGLVLIFLLSGRRTPSALPILQSFIGNSGGLIEASHFSGRRAISQSFLKSVDDQNKGKGFRI
jgi:hypothetical protein